MVKLQVVEEIAEKVSGSNPEQLERELLSLRERLEAPSEEDLRVQAEILIADQDKFDLLSPGDLLSDKTLRLVVEGKYREETEEKIQELSSRLELLKREQAELKKRQLEALRRKFRQMETADQPAPASEEAVERGIEVLKFKFKRGLGNVDFKLFQLDESEHVPMSEAEERLRRRHSNLPEIVWQGAGFAGAFRGLMCKYIKPLREKREGLKKKKQTAQNKIYWAVLSDRINLIQSLINAINKILVQLYRKNIKEVYASPYHLHEISKAVQEDPRLRILSQMPKKPKCAASQSAKKAGEVRTYALREEAYSRLVRYARLQERKPLAKELAVEVAAVMQKEKARDWDEAFWKLARDYQEGLPDPLKTIGEKARIFLQAGRIPEERLLEHLTS